MQRVVGAAVGLVMLAAAGSAGAQAYGSGPRPAYAAPGYGGACPTGYHGEGTACICDYPVDFYPGNGGGYPGGPGYPGGYGGYNVHFSSPGVRVTGRPVNVPSGAIYIDGPPIYVQAPPVRVASPQVYIQRPNVVVAPSQVTVDAPTVHVEGCAEGSTCELSGQSYPTQGYQAPPSHYRARGGERG